MNNIAKTLMFIEKYIKKNKEVSPDQLMEMIEKKLNEDADEFFLFLLEYELISLTEEELICGKLILGDDLDYDEIAVIYEERFLSISLTQKQTDACEKMSELFIEIKKKKKPTMKELEKIVENKEDLHFLINVMKRKGFINIDNNNELLTIGHQGRMIKKISDPTRVAIESLIDEELEKNQNEEDKKDIRDQILETNNMSFYIIRVLNSYSNAIPKPLILSKIKNMIGLDIVEEEAEKKFEIVMAELIKCGFLKIKRSIGFMNNEEVYLSRLSNSFYPSFIDENRCILIPYSLPNKSSSQGKGKEVEGKEEEYDEEDYDDEEDYEEDFEYLFSNIFSRRRKRSDLNAKQ